MSVTDDIIAKSVTSDDVMTYEGKGVVNFVMPYWWATPRVFALPTDLPPYWSYQRDVVLRNSVLYEPFWSSAVGIAVNKVAAQSFDISGDVPRRVSDAQEMMVEWGGDGYVSGMSKLMLDYFTTDNGAFVEIVREKSAMSSKIIGLVHLDSLRCQRTGDPDIPVLFRDLKGGLHDLKYYQVMSFTDMPDSSMSWLGVGHCAAERAYDKIYMLAGINRTLNEKITGAGAHQMAFIQGMSPKQINDMLSTAKSEATAKGLQYYLGTIIAGIMGDSPVDVKTLQLRGLPDNFDPKEMLSEALLAYANALGLVLTDLQPLSGQGLGTGKQSEVLEDKAQGRTIAAFRKMFTQAINEWVMPDKTTFIFSERDLRDERQQAEVSNLRQDERDKMIASGLITAQEGRQLAVDDNDLPDEFITVDTTGEQSLGDEERADSIEQEPVSEAVGQAPQVAPVAEQSKPEAQAQSDGMSKPQEQKVEAALDKLNLSGIQITSAMGIVRQVASGEITRDQGVSALQILLNLSEDQANRLIGGASVMKEHDEAATAALLSLRDEIKAAREALVNA